MIERLKSIYIVHTLCLKCMNKSHSYYLLAYFDWGNYWPQNRILELYHITISLAIIYASNI